MNTCEVWEPTFDSAESAMHFGPSFLNQDWPDLSTMTGAECNSVRSFVYRYLVIDDDWRLGPINIQENAVDSCLVGIFSSQEIEDLFWELTHGAHYGQEIAVSKISLLNIIWMDSIDNHLRVFNDLSNSLPLQSIIHFFLVLGNVIILIINGADLCGEILINVLLSLLNNRLHILKSIVTFLLGILTTLL